jgi:hypothetical protein
MADFSPNAKARILRATSIVEKMSRRLLPEGALSTPGFVDWKLFELTDTLVPWGVVDAAPVVWTASSDSPAADRRGSYAVDAEADLIEIREATGRCYGVKGEWIWCRAIGADSGTVWIAMTSGSPILYGRLEGDLDCNDEMASATLSVYVWNGDAGWEDCGVDVTVGGRLFPSLGKILANSMVQAEWSLLSGTPIVTAGGKAARILATATDDFLISAETFEAQVEDWWKGDDPDPESGGLTIENVAGMFYGESGSKWICDYDPENDVYRAIQGSCPETET